jgi:hypothetical protein
MTFTRPSPLCDHNLSSTTNQQHKFFNKPRRIDGRNTEVICCILPLHVKERGGRFRLLVIYTEYAGYTLYTYIKYTHAHYTDKKENLNFLINKEFQTGAVAKS